LFVEQVQSQTSGRQSSIEQVLVQTLCPQLSIDQVPLQTLCPHLLVEQVRIQSLSRRASHITQKDMSEFRFCFPFCLAQLTPTPHHARTAKR
jgi:hypothetical protein